MWLHFVSCFIQLKLQSVAYLGLIIKLISMRKVTAILMKAERNMYTVCKIGMTMNSKVAKICHISQITYKNVRLSLSSLAHDHLKGYDSLVVGTIQFWESSQRIFNHMATLINHRNVKYMQNIGREVARYFELTFLFFSLKNLHHQEQGLKTTILEIFPTIAEKHQFSISMLAMKLLSKPYQVWLRVCMIWQDMFNPKLKWHQCMEKCFKIVLIASHDWNKDNLTFYE